MYVGECIAIGLRGMFGLCTFDSPYNLGGRGFVGFDLILLGMLFFSTRILVFCAIVLDLYQVFCMLCPKEDSSPFSYIILMCS